MNIYVIYKKKTQYHNEFNKVRRQLFNYIAPMIGESSLYIKTMNRINIIRLQAIMSPDVHILKFIGVGDKCRRFKHSYRVRSHQRRENHCSNRHQKGSKTTEPDTEECQVIIKDTCPNYTRPMQQSKPSIQRI